MKKLAVLILIFSVLLGTGAFAEENTLTLDDAINQALENSQKLKVDDLNIQNAQKVYEQAQKDSDNIYMSDVENEKWYVTDSKKDPAYVTTKREAKELTPEQREYDLNVALKSKDADKVSIKLDIYNAYYSLIKAQDDIKIKSDLANISGKKLKNIESKYRRGLASKNDYKLAQIAKKNADIQLKLSQRAQKRLIAKLYKQMNAGYQPDVKDLVKNLDYRDLSDVNIDECIKNAKDNRLEIYMANETVRLKQLEFDIVDMYYDEGDIEYKDAANNLENAKLSLETTNADIEFEIRTDYNNLQNMLDTIEINKVEAQKDELNYSVLKTKRSIGMATALEVDEAKQSLDKANMDLDDSIMDYIISKAQFDEAQGIGSAILEKTSVQ